MRGYEVRIRKLLKSTKKDCAAYSLHWTKTVCYDTETLPRLFARRHAGRLLRTALPATRREPRRPGDFREADDRPDDVRPCRRLRRRRRFHLQGHSLCQGGALRPGRRSRPVDGRPSQPGLRSHGPGARPFGLVVRRPGFHDALGRRFPRRGLPSRERLDRRNRRWKEASCDGLAPWRRIPRGVRPGAYKL